MPTKHVIVHSPTWCLLHLSYTCLCFDRKKEFIEYNTPDVAAGGEKED